MAKKLLSCILVGASPLLIVCAEYLLKKNFQISLIISEDDNVINWATKNNIFIGSDINLLNSYNPDYLFSIVNFSIFSPKNLSKVRKLSINFHDSLLPRYAGSHTATWVLLNLERKHGVTWHKISDGIDEGDILEQESFNLLHDETVEMLNIKCFDAAITSFRRLINAIVKNNIKPVKQNLKRRSFYTKNCLPKNYAIISIDMSAEEIFALVRGLNFGKKYNPICLPKIIIGEVPFILGRIEINKNSLLNVPPGKIISLGADYIEVSTKSLPIKIYELQDIFGSKASIADVIKEHKLVKDQFLSDSLLSFDLDEISLIANKLKLKEACYFNVINKNIFQITPIIQKAYVFGNVQYRLASTLSLKKFLKINACPSQDAFFILSLILLYIANLNGEAVLPLIVEKESFNGGKNTFQNLFSFYSFIRMQINEKHSIDKFAQNLKQEVSSSEGGVLNDFIARIRVYDASILQKQFIKIVFSKEPVIFSKNERVNDFYCPIIINVIANKAIQIFLDQEHFSYPIFRNFSVLLQYLTTQFKMGKSIGEFEYVLPDKATSLTKLLCGKVADYPCSEIFYDSFEKNFSNQQNRIAIKTEKGRIKYNELSKIVNYYAFKVDEVQKKYVAPVAVVCNNEPGALVAILACIQKSVPFLPISPDISKKNFNHILSANSIKLILCSENLLANTRNNLENNNKIITILPLVLANKTSRRVVANSGNETAYIIYTSGSTGAPKGVRVSYASLFNVLNFFRKEWRVVKNSTFLSITAISFDISILELLLPIFSGGGVAFVENAKGLTGERLYRQALKAGITHIQTTPSRWEALIQTGFRKMSGLTAISGGEALSSKLASKLFSLSKNLFNVYGPTETTIWSSSMKFKERSQEISLGKPISNTYFYVLNKKKKLCPPGVPGELYIGGLGVAIGYVFDDLQEELRFLPDLISPQQGKIFKTGDVVIFDKNKLKYVARNDTQFKINGIRGDLNEINNTLKACPFINDAIVLFENGKLIANVIPNAPEDFLLLEEINRFVRFHIRSNLTISHVICFDFFPTTINGKVNYQELKRIAGHAMKNLSEAIDFSPNSEIENELLLIWSNLLKRKNNTTRENFFLAGGSSLLAIQLLSEIQKSFNIELPLKLIFDYPTIEGQAKLITNMLAHGSLENISYKKLVKAPRNYNKPSYAQERIYFLCKLFENEPFYNMPFAFSIKGNINIKRLENAIKKVILGNKIFQTKFIEINGRLELLSELYQPHTEVINISTANENLVLDKLFEDSREIFNLKAAGLYRIKLYILGKERIILFCNFHHLISDGASVNVFLSELSAHYNNQVNNKLNKDDYLDFVWWEREYYKDTNLEKRLVFWKKYLNDADYNTPLPYDYIEDDIARKFIGDRHYFSLNSHIYARIQKISEKYFLSPFIFLLGIYFLAWHKYLGKNDVLIGTVAGNRRYAEFENIIGFLANTTLVRSKIENQDISFLNYLTNLKNDIIQILDTAEVPFEKLVSSILPERDYLRNPLFQTVFVWQNANEKILQLDKLNIDPITLNPKACRFDFAFYVKPQDNTISCYIEYAVSLFQRETIVNFSEVFLKILNQCINDVELRLSNISYLTNNQLRQLQKYENSRVPDLCQNLYTDTVHGEFKKIAKEYSCNIAVQLAGEQISYAELDEVSDRVAGYLTSLDFLDEGFSCGIYPERNIQTIIIILSVLKANGTYVPLDLSWPDDRIQYVLDDADCKIVISTAKIEGKTFFNNQKHLVADELIISANRKDFRKLLKHGRASQGAYTIYTSGSTGMPKGVKITHENLLSLFRSTNTLFDFRNTDVWCQFHSYAFDFSVWEVFGALLHGARLVIVPYNISRDSNHFYKFICQFGITILNQTPSAFKMLSYENVDLETTSLRYIIFGGEKLDFSSLANYLSSKSIKFINMYGITEITVHATFYFINSYTRESVIGKPLPGFVFKILNDFLEPLPIGVFGELYISGPGVAKGYLNNPALTQKKFIKINGSHQKYYRTGDIVKWRWDGNLVYDCRNDGQVKVRGYRIEIGEIENAIKSHPLISDAVVLVNDDNEKQLCAYTIINKDAYNDGEVICKWKDIFFETYRSHDEQDKSFDTTGWYSSYTNKTIPKIEMREWLDTTIKRLKLLNLKNVLEIGCGTGMIACEVIKECNSYIGIDITDEAIKKTEAAIKSLNISCSNVHLFTATADNFYLPEGAEIDTIILNSVVQYFPSASYFFKVLRKLMKLLVKGGAIFLGDIRNLDLIDFFYADIFLENKKSSSQAAMLKFIEDNKNSEKELLISPKFFYWLREKFPEVSNVAIFPKKGHFKNELNEFRYDVIIDVKYQSEVETPNSFITLDFNDNNFTKLDQLLALKKTNQILIRRIENNFIKGISNALNGSRLASKFNLHGKDFCFLLREKIRAPYQLQPIYYDFNDQVHYFDVLIFKNNNYHLPHRDANLIFKDGFEHFFNSPKLNTFNISDLKTYLANRLPKYMIPSRIFIVEKFPINQNGKVDKKSLLKVVKNTTSGNILTPVNTTEEKLLRIWKEILNLDDISTSDNYFDLGGDSILSIQMLAKAKNEGFNITLRDIFLHQTIASLAKYVNSNAVEISVNDKGMLSAISHRLSPIQKWFFSLELKNYNHWYMSYLAKLGDVVDTFLLEQAIKSVIERHEIFNMRFKPSKGKWVKYYTNSENKNFTIKKIILSDFCLVENSNELYEDIYSHCDICIANGPLINAFILLDASKQKSNLLLIAHHLIIDGVSWKILIDDILHTLSGDQAKLLPRHSEKFAYENFINETSFKKKDIAFLKGFIPDIARDKPHAILWEKNTYDSFNINTLNIDKDLSRNITLMASKLRLRIDTFLLVAFVRAYLEWANLSELSIDIESHGRGAGSEETVGWFTSFYPVTLTKEKLKYNLSSLFNVNDALLNGSEFAIPYMISREDNEYLPYINFNYFGKSSYQENFKQVLFIPKWQYDPRGIRPYLLDVNALLDEKGFVLKFGYSENLHTGNEIDLLARLVIKHLRLISKLKDRRQETNGNNLLAFNLVPQHKNFLLASKAVQKNPGFHLLYFSLNRNDTDKLRLEKSLTQVLQKNDIFLAEFLNYNGKNKIIFNNNIKCKVEKIFFQKKYFRNENSFNEFLEGIKSSLISLQRAPLLKIYLLEYEDRLVVLLRYSQMILDGWSLSLLFNQLTSYYTEDAIDISTGSYAEFLEKFPYSHNKFNTLLFWKKFLRNITQSGSPLSKFYLKQENKLYQNYCAKSFILSKEETDDIVIFARENKITLNLLINAAWAILLYVVSGKKEIVFSAMISTRGFSVANVDNTLGLFTNTLPVKISFAENDSLNELFSQLKTISLNFQEYWNVSIEEIYQALELNKSKELFDSLMIFQNFPIKEEAFKKIGEVELSDFTSIEYNNYPLTIRIYPEKHIRIKFGYKRDFFDDNSVTLIFKLFSAILKDLQFFTIEEIKTKLLTLL